VVYVIEAGEVEILREEFVGPGQRLALLAAGDHSASSGRCSASLVLRRPGRTRT